MNEIKQLRWRCRRGTLELDLILLRYLDNHYLAADKAEQMAFQQLLALEDIELIRYLMADELPSDQGLLRVVAQLRIDDVIN
jgi:antitoxin CptB